MRERAPQTLEYKADLNALSLIGSIRWALSSQQTSKSKGKQHHESAEAQSDRPGENALP
jgi:hypothetical protein